MTDHNAVPPEMRELRRLLAEEQRTEPGREATAPLCAHGCDGGCGFSPDDPCDLTCHEEDDDA